MHAPQVSGSLYLKKKNASTWAKGTPAQVYAALQHEGIAILFYNIILFYRDDIFWSLFLYFCFSIHFRVYSLYPNISGPMYLNRTFKESLPSKETFKLTFCFVWSREGWCEGRTMVLVLFEPVPYYTGSFFLFRKEKKCFPGLQCYRILKIPNIVGASGALNQHIKYNYVIPLLYLNIALKKAPRLDKHNFILFVSMQNWYRVSCDFTS